MIGHTVPWCIGCGLEEHHPDLFDEFGDPIFDDDAFDREVIAARLGGGLLSREAVAEALGITRGSVAEAVASGRLPAPAREVFWGERERDVWTAYQVADCLLTAPSRRVRSTHCANGHELVEGKVYVRKNGTRECLECRWIRQARHRAAKRARAERAAS